MELCKTCKGECKKNIVIIEEEKLKTIKCLDYEKDKDKIKGYKEPEYRTAKLEKTVQGIAGVWG